MRKLIKDVVDHRLKTEQLSETKLTLQNLEEVVDSFTATLRGVYHPRIEYPQADSDTKPAPSQVAETPQEPSTVEDPR